MRSGDAVDAARAEGRAALVGYLPVGFPDVEGSIAAARAMVEDGIDVVELGLPYSDPLMDGPVIQDAVDAALRGGTRTRDVLTAVEQVAATGAPVLVMTYWNPIDRYGVDRFAADLAAAGGAGLITPDLVPDEGADWLAAAGAHHPGRGFLVAPPSPPPAVPGSSRPTSCRTRARTGSPPRRRTTWIGSSWSRRRRPRSGSAAPFRPAGAGSTRRPRWA